MASAKGTRIIMLLDLDSFYASAEELRHPELKGKPIAICMFSGRTNDSGAIATANYSARALGIHAGMYIAQAKRLAQKAVSEGKDETSFLPADRVHYKQISDRIMALLRKHADALEQVSIDEAYMDVTSRTGSDFKTAERLANAMKKELLAQERLTCSIGIGPTKAVAKMAASAKKPDGMTVIEPSKVKAFLDPLPVKKLHGIGPKTTEMMESMGIKTIGELAAYDVTKLKPLLGERRAEAIWHRSRGEDDDPVQEGERKQIGRIVTLKKDSRDAKYIASYIHEMADDVASKTNGIMFRTVSIHIVTTMMETKTRSRTLDKATGKTETITAEAEELIRTYLKENPNDVIRRFGITVSSFESQTAEKEETKTKPLFRFLHKV